MNKKERHEFYKLWLEKHIKICNEDHNDIGLCNSFELTNYILKKYHNINLFPEIIKHSPEGNEFAPYWFSHDMEGVNKRIEILQSAIRETAPKKIFINEKTIDTIVYIFCVIAMFILLTVMSINCNGQTVKEINHIDGKSIAMIQFPEYKNFWGVWQIKGTCRDGNEIFRNGSPLNLNNGFDLFPGCNSWTYLKKWQIKKIVKNQKIK